MPAQFVHLIQGDIRMFRRFFAVALAVATCFAMVQPAFAEYPDKNIKVIVPYSAGGGVDVPVRMMADLAGPYINGHKLIVENMPAGGSIAGSTAVFKAPADGYTMLGYTPTTIMAALTRQTPFKVDSFKPIAAFCQDPTVIVVRADSPIKDLKQFMDTAKQRKIIINISAPGNIPQLGGMLLEKQFNVQFSYVVAKSGGMQITQLLGGHVEAALLSLGEASVNIAAGKVRCIGIMSDKKYEGFENLTPFSSIGFFYTGMNGERSSEWGTTRGLAVRADTPDDVVKKLDEIFGKVINTPEFQARMQKAGFPCVYMNSETFSQTMDNIAHTCSFLLQDQIKAN